MMPHTIKALLDDARAAGAEGEFDEAEGLLLRLISELESDDDPGPWDRAVVSYARLLVEAGRWDTAGLWIQRALDHDGSEAAPRIVRLALDAASESNVARVLDAIAPERVFDSSQLVKMSERIARRGNCSVAVGLVDRVLCAARRTDREKLDCGVAYHAGRVLYMASRRVEAVQVWRAGLKDEKAHAGIALWLSRELERTRAFEECLTVLRAAIERDTPHMVEFLARQARVATELAKQSERPSDEISREQPDPPDVGPDIILAFDRADESERLQWSAIQRRHCMKVRRKHRREREKKNSNGGTSHLHVHGPRSIANRASLRIGDGRTSGDEASARWAAQSGVRGEMRDARATVVVRHRGIATSRDETRLEMGATSEET